MPVQPRRRRHPSHGRHPVTMRVVRVSSKGDYACRALLSLAVHDDEPGPTSVRDIAERTGIPQPYLEQILLALKGAGLVRSKRGVGGGYVLARPPDGDPPQRDPLRRRRADQPRRLRRAAPGRGLRPRGPVRAAGDLEVRRRADAPPARRLHPAVGGRRGPWRRALAGGQAVARPLRRPSEPGPASPSRSEAPARRRHGLRPRRGRRAAATSKCSASRVTGWRRPMLGGVQERAGHVEQVADAAVGAVADDRVADRGEVDADLVGAPGLQPAAQRGDLRRVGRSCAARGTRCGPGARRRRPPSASGRGGRGRSGRRSPRRVRRVAPHQRAVGRARRGGPASAATSAAYAAACGRRRAARWCRRRGGGRCPDGAASPTPASSGKRASRPLTSVPSGCPAPGWTTSPAGLSTTITSSSTWTTWTSTVGSATGGTAAGSCVSSIVDHLARAQAHLARRGRRRRRPCTAPAVDQRRRRRPGWRR